MEPEGSSPHLQEPTTCLYPAKISSVHAPPSYFLKIYFNSIFLFTLRSSN